MNNTDQPIGARRSVNIPIQRSIAFFDGTAATAKQQALRQLHEAVDLIPAVEKEVYLTAMRLAPKLVQEESDPLRFLRVEGFNPWAAARRLVTYWRERREIFQDRAFLPLDLTGQGALTEEAVDFVASGCLCILPTLDSNGRAVILFDRSRLPAIYKDRRDLKLQYGFFMFSTLSTYEAAQMAGYVVVVRFWTNAAGQFDRAVMAKCADLIQSAMPAKFQRIHVVVCLPSKAAGRTFRDTIVPVVLQKLGNFFSKSATIHVCEGPDTVLQTLSPHGFKADCLPDYWGGRWTFDDFVQWSVERGWKSNRSTGIVAVDTEEKEQKKVRSDARSMDGLGLLGDAAERALAEEEEATTVEQRQIPSSLPHDTSLAQKATVLNNSVDAVFEETVEMVERGRMNLEEAFNTISETDKAAYMEAVQRVPFLVEAESSPINFLRYERYNAWAAAKRLATYWKNRAEIFGDRAFLPMTQTGDGALNEEDILILNSGFFAFLPSSNGRTVICYDPSRKIEHAHAHESGLRVAFYIWSVICENEISVKDGFVGIVLLGRPGFGTQKFNDTARVAIDLVLESFPTRQANVLVIHCPPRPPEKPTFFRATLMPLIFKLLGRVLDERASLYADSSETELLEKLKSHGLSKAGLPGGVGGEWTYDKFNEWQTERLAVERERYEQKLPVAQRQTGVSANFGLERQQRGRVEFDEALLAIPDSEKTAYLEALRCSPDLVRKESDAIRFLRHAQYDAMSAARRFLAYWQVRTEIFGDRAFLPLDQTGDGALERKDIGVLTTCYLVQLPDSNDRTVLFCDGARLKPCSFQSRLRCTFYMHSIASENEMSQTDGYVALYAMSEPNFDQAYKDCLDLVTKALPIRLAEFHLFGFPSEPERAFFYGELVPATLEVFGENVKEKSIVHLGTSRQDIAAKLEAHGLRRLHLPKSIGGDWSFDQFTQWQELRIRFEWGLPVGYANKGDAGLFSFSSVEELQEMTEEGKAERKRRMSIVHSRRKRDRQRIRLEGMREQCAELEEQQEQLRQENQRLEQLVGEALSVVGQHRTDVLHGDAAALDTGFSQDRWQEVLARSNEARVPVGQNSSMHQSPLVSNGLMAFQCNSLQQSMVEQLILQQQQQQRQQDAIDAAALCRELLVRQHLLRAQIGQPYLNQNASGQQGGNLFPRAASGGAPALDPALLEYLNDRDNEG